MTQSDEKKLRTILAKVETLQHQTTDEALQSRLQSAKNELLRALPR